VYRSVKHRASSDFWDCYNELPQAVRRVADRAFNTLKRDPRHPSLHLKRVGAYWSVRVGRRHRAVGIERGTDLVWFWIGTHAQYDQLIGR